MNAGREVAIMAASASFEQTGMIEARRAKSSPADMRGTAGRAKGAAAEGRPGFRPDGPGARDNISRTFDLMY